MTEPAHKGSRWSRTDDAMLRRLAGTMDVAQLAAILRRTERSVVWRAGQLGVRVECPAETLLRCPRCGAWRTRLVGGVCVVCRKEETRDALRRRERELEDLVSADYRERADARRRERPVRVPTGGMDAAQRERLLCERLDRENATIRRRCERMEAWLREHRGDSV